MNLPNVVVVGGIATVATATNIGLNNATGENRQPEDRRNVATGFIFDSSSSATKCSPASILWLLGKGDEGGNENMSNTMLQLFREHDDYRNVRVNNFIQQLHTKNPECGIRHGNWDNPLHMDIFQAFGAPGHSGVHSGLLIAYPGFDKWFVTISIDLQAIPKDILENSQIPEDFDGCGSILGGNLNVVKHTLDVVDGIDEKIWPYKKSVCMSLLKLFEFVAKAMEAGNKRSQEYKMFNSNCIHFKNDILEMIKATEDEKKIPYKNYVTKFNLNVATNPTTTSTQPNPPTTTTH